MDENIVKGINSVNGRKELASESFLVAWLHYSCDLTAQDFSVAYPCTVQIT